MTHITSVEIKKASNGNTYKQVTLNKKFFGDKDRFNAFNDHAMYNDLVEQGEIDETMLYINSRGYLELTNPDKGLKRPTGRKNFDVGASMERKKENIAEAQGNKEYGIKIASTAAQATQIVVELMKQDPLLEWPREWQKVRQWLWEHWEIEKPDKPVY